MYKWHYKTLEDVKQELEKLGVDIPFSDNLSVLAEPLEINGKVIPNRIVYQPMEAGDCAPDGTPSEQTIKRYKDFAKGGPGIIWVEAVPVVPEGRSNPHQMYLHEDNLDEFKKFVDNLRNECFEENKRDTCIIIQYTHTGRYSHPKDKGEPVIAQFKPCLEEENKPDESAIISDEELKRFEEAMGKSSYLAEQAGFDGADIKCCHGYLTQEFLTAYDRPGPYGGSFENRTRLIMNCIENAKAQTKSPFILSSRINVYDGLPHPWGFGADDDATPDITEPLMLVELMKKSGIKLINVSSGSPSRFYMTCPKGQAPEHPLLGVARLLSLTGKIKEANKDLLVVSSAYSYLRKFSPMAAAGSIVEGLSDMVGYGRLPFAYPEAARDILQNKFDENKLCLCCDACWYPCKVRSKK